MATRPRRGGSGAATPRRPVQPAYEDFEPTSRWAEDDKNHILTIDLPGFTREQVRVSTEDLDIIRVRGERPITRTRIIHFQHDFQVPANSDMNRVRAKLEGGILVITVEKKNIESPREVKPLKDTVAETPKPPITQKEQDRHPPAAEERKPRDKSPEPASSDPTKKQDQADVPRDGRKGTPFRDARKILPQDFEITGIKEKHVTEKTAEMEENASKTRNELPDTESAKKTKLKMGNEAPTSAAAKENGEESKGKHKIHTNGTDIGASTMEKHKESGKELTDLNEERQSLVNMGVAVLVIMALSAYVTYQFASGKYKN